MSRLPLHVRFWQKLPHSGRGCWIAQQLLFRRQRQTGLGSVLGRQIHRVPWTLSNYASTFLRSERVKSSMTHRRTIEGRTSSRRAEGLECLPVSTPSGWMGLFAEAYSLIKEFWSLWAERVAAKLRFRGFIRGRRLRPKALNG